MIKFLQKLLGYTFIISGIFTFSVPLISLLIPLNFIIQLIILTILSIYIVATINIQSMDTNNIFAFKISSRFS